MLSEDYRRFTKGKVINFKHFLNNKLLIFLLIIGIAAQVAIIFPSGTSVDGDIVFWGAQYHDALWHISLMQKLGYLSFENPVFAGETLGNYHYLMNFIIGLVHRLTGIHLFILVYKMFPILISVLIGFLTYILTRTLFKSESAAFWSVFFVYFGSTFAYLLPLFNLGAESWETSLWVQQSVSIFNNLPFAASLPVFLLGIIYVKKYLDDKKIKYAVLSVVLFGTLPVIKSFAIIVLGSLLVVGLIRVVTEKNTDLIIISIASILLSVLLLSPTLRFGDSHFIYEPGWFLRSMMESSDRVGWQDWSLKLQHYRSVGADHQIFRLYLISFLVFVIGNLGTRIVAVVPLIKNLKKILNDEIHQLMLISGYFFFIIPILFLTSGIAWNSIQFFYYFLFISGIYAGWGVEQILRKLEDYKYKVLFAGVVIALTIPVNLNTISHSVLSPPGAKISGEEYQLLNKMRDEGTRDQSILTIPIERSFIHVPAVTGMSTHLGDELMAVVPGHNYFERYDEIEDSLQHEEDFYRLSKKYSLDWLYINASEEYEVEQFESIKEFYSNNSLRVYRIRLDED